MSAAPMASEPLWELVEESLDEAVFLWKRWEGELSSPERNLDEIWTWTEDRLHGALDGVRAAGGELAGRLASTSGLQSDEPARLTVSAHLLAALSAPSARALLAESVRAADAPRLRHFARGMETAQLDASFAAVTAALTTGGPLHAGALCRLKAFRRARAGREVQEAFESGVPECQAEALRAARNSGDPAHRKLIATALRHETVEARCSAIESGLVLGMPEAWAAAVDLGRQLDAGAARMLTVLAMLGGPAEHQLVMAALRKPELQRHAIYALGFLGTPEAVETCLAGMTNDKLARHAGEAYCAITGAQLERDRLAAPEPAEPPSIPFEAEDLEAGLVPSAPDLWPLPDIDAVRRHWAGIRAGFSPGQRLYLGRQVSLATLVDAVEQGPMLRRADVLRELAIRTSGKYDVEPRAFARTQREMMRAGRAALSSPAR